MADIASEAALQHLKSLYSYGEITSSSDGNLYRTLIIGLGNHCDTLVIQNPWYIVTLVSFTAANRPEAVPLLFKYVLGELEHTQNQFKVPEAEASREKFILSRKFRDATFKCGIIAGYSKVFASLSQTNQCGDKLLSGNKRSGLSSRGYARRTTRHETTEVSDRAHTHRLSNQYCRETNLSLPELESRGEVFFRALYGETTNDVQGLLDKIYPDMGTHTILFQSAF